MAWVVTDREEVSYTQTQRPHHPLCGRQAEATAWSVMLGLGIRIPGLASSRTRGGTL